MQLKRFFAVLPVLALSTAFVAAQTPQPSSTPSQPNQTTQTTVGQPTDTNEPVYKGCVSGTKDNYILTSSDGKTFRLHSDKDIAEHVGKMVELRGTIKKEGADRPADAMPASSTSEIDVADLKNVEGTCPIDNSGAAASKDAPKAYATAPNSQTAASDSAAAKSDVQKATLVETPAASATASTSAAPAASVSTTETATQPAASASVSTSPNTTTEPSANAAVSTTDQTAAVPANNATNQNATASAGAEQKTEADSAKLPQTASPLPLLGLLGFASTGLGLLMRRRK